MRANIENIMNLKQRGNNARQIDGKITDIQTRYNALLKSTFFCTYIHDFEGRFLDANNAALRLLGYGNEEIPFLHVNSLFSEDQMILFNAVIEQGKRGCFQKKPVELRLRKKNGDYVWTEAEACILYENNRPYAIQWIARDITPLKKQMEELLNRSLIDDLTGLYNRRAFIALAEQQMRSAVRLKQDIILFFADVDNLKWVNDTIGHHEGDTVLITTAKILKQTFRSSDIIARIGGDEFVVLTIGTRKTFAGILTSRLQEKLKVHTVKNRKEYLLSLSIGITTYNHEHLCSVHDLLASADKMMYNQKRSKLRYSSPCAATV